MKKEVHIREGRTRNVLILVAICTGLGVLYPILSREFDDPLAFVNGATIGLIGGVFIALYEQNVFKPQNRKISFIKKVIIKSLIYTSFFSLVILAVVSLTRSIENGQSILEYVTGSQFADFVFREDFHIIILYTLLLSASISFTRQLSRKMGQGVLWSFITGKYHRPREEERIFMFLDLSSSTTIAERLGEIKYNEFLNEFFYDITGSILATKGEVYRYVGDEVVVSWTMKAGFRNANCIRTYFLALNAIHRQKEKYFTRYEFVPRFTAGLHCGKVIRGEIGDVKSQIAFLGDVLYTAARTEKQCGKLEKQILITADVMKRLSVPDIYEMEFVGKLGVNAKQKEYDLYTLNEVELEAV